MFSSYIHSDLPGSQSSLVETLGFFHGDLLGMHACMLGYTTSLDMVRKWMCLNMGATQPKLKVQIDHGNLEKNGDSIGFKKVDFG